jgi:uncharacterized protein (TIGR00369 family)
MTGPSSRAEGFEPLPPDQADRWSSFGRWEGRTYFPTVVGLVVEEVRSDYCRMRLPFRPELQQPAGIVHGGAIATLIDSVVVPAIGSAYGPDARYATIDMQIQYLGAVVEEDAIGEGWVVQRGRSVVFCEADVVGATSGRRLARGLLTYKVSPA